MASLIKWTNKLVEEKRDLKNIILFCTLNKVKNPTVTTYDITKVETVEGLHFEFIPASLYCYTVGRNIVRYKNL